MSDVCTDLHCINMNMSAQCNDPVHTTQVFAPQANSTPAVVQQPNNIIPGQSGVGDDLTSNEHTQRPMLAQHNVQVHCRDVATEEPMVFDPINLEHWVRYNDSIHTRVGPYKMKIKSVDPTTGFQVERTVNVKYKTRAKVLFQTTKNLKADDVWIANTASFEAYSASFHMTPSTSELLSDTNYLDSFIDDVRKIPLDSFSRYFTRRFW